MPLRVCVDGVEVGGGEVVARDAMLTYCPVGFCHEHALILYVYIPKDEDGGDESVLTVSCRRLRRSCRRLGIGLMLDQYYISTYSA